MLEVFENLNISTKSERITTGHPGFDSAIGGGLKPGFAYQFRGKAGMESIIGRHINSISHKAIVVTDVDCSEDLIALKIKARESNVPVIVMRALKKIRLNDVNSCIDVIVNVYSNGAMYFDKNRGGRTGEHRVRGNELIYIG